MKRLTQVLYNLLIKELGDAPISYWEKPLQDATALFYERQRRIYEIYLREARDWPESCGCHNGIVLYKAMERVDRDLMSPGKSTPSSSSL